MELRQVEALLAVAELGSFSRAAEKLGYSQSAVTMQIKQLEHEVGTRLLDRLPRGAVLTQQGRAFAFHARELMAEAGRAVAAVRPDTCDAPEMVGTLRIGSVESVASVLLPRLLAAYHERYPHIELVVRTMHGDRLIEGVRENRLDLFLTTDRLLSARGLTRVVQREEDVVFAASPDLACHVGRVRLDGLALMPLVLTERGESYRYELERLLADRDEQLHPVVEAGGTELLVRLAERGVGVAFLPRFAAADALARGTLVELASELAPIRVWNQLFVHKDKPLDGPLRAFVELVDGVKL